MSPDPTGAVSPDAVVAMSGALPLPRRRLPEGGEMVGPYEVVAPIAQGGMAEVFLVRRRSLGGFERRLAMKVMHPHLAGDTAFVHMFLDEARIASCIDHPNVVKVLDVGTENGLPWLVMEWLDGKSLAEVLMKQPRLSAQLRAHALSDAATGLHAAHEACGPDGVLLNVVHRDVSPQNVHVGYDGMVKLVDFGVAAARGRLTRTETGLVKGKVGYLAPEQLQFPNEPATRSVDTWAFGVMAWETLAVRRLFGGSDAGTKMYQIVHAPVPPLGELAPDVPREITDLVMQCLERDPARRPASMSEIARTLKEVAGDLHAREAIAAHMASAFAAERVALDARFEALRTGAPISEDRMKVVMGGASELEPTRIPREAAAPDPQPAPQPVARVAAPWVLALAALLAMGGAAGLAWAWRGSVDADGSAERAARLAPEEPPGVGPAEAPSLPAAEPATSPVHTDLVSATTPDEPVLAPSPHVIELEVGRNVRTVTVDGVERSERPIRIELGDGAHAALEIVGTDGRRARRTVDASDDGALLALPPRIWSSPYD
jgi:hypothetical protein